MWQRTPPQAFHQSGLSDRRIGNIYSRPPFQTVIVDNEGIDVRKLDDFLALRFVRLTLLDPIHIRTA
jgi:hypothetical protein